MHLKPWDVEDLSEAQAKDYLAELIEKLDELDGDDFFGAEGWRHFVMQED